MTCDNADNEESCPSKMGDYANATVLRLALRQPRINPKLFECVVPGLLRIEEE